jgi:hypothetical protein
MCPKTALETGSTIADKSGRYPTIVNVVKINCLGSSQEKAQAFLEFRKEAISRLNRPKKTAQIRFTSFFGGSCRGIFSSRRSWTNRGQKKQCRTPCTSLLTARWSEVLWLFRPRTFLLECELNVGWMVSHSECVSNNVLGTDPKRSPASSNDTVTLALSIAAVYTVCTCDVHEEGNMGAGLKHKHLVLDQRKINAAKRYFGWSRNKRRSTEPCPCSSKNSG